MTDDLQLPTHSLIVHVDGKVREVDLRTVSAVRKSWDVAGSVSQAIGRAHWSCWIEFHNGAEPLAFDMRDFDRAFTAYRGFMERRASSNVTEFSGKNLDEQNQERPLIELDGWFEVYSWVPGRDGQGTPLQVHVQIPLRIADVAITAVCRFKTVGALNALIDALVKHREEVWPTS